MENRSLRNVHWFPYPAGGQAVAYTGAAFGNSGALTVGKEYLIWITHAAWCRPTGPAVANDHAFPVGAVFSYIPTIAGVDDQLSFLAIDPAAIGCAAYISRAER